MPRVVPLRDGPPVTVAEAGQAFGSTLRLRLIRHYLDSPGSQKAAAEALGISRALASINTKALMALGVVVEDSGIYSVDCERLRELTSAITNYLHRP